MPRQGRCRAVGRMHHSAVPHLELHDHDCAQGALGPVLPCHAGVERRRVGHDRALVFGQTWPRCEVPVVQSMVADLTDSTTVGSAFGKASKL